VIRGSARVRYVRGSLLVNAKCLNNPSFSRQVLSARGQRGWPHVHGPASCGVGHRRLNCFRLCTSLAPCRWACGILPVAARFRAPRVANELAPGRAIVAHSRSFSRSRAEAAGGNPGSDGGGTVRKETARGAQVETSCFLTKRNVQTCRGGRPPGRRIVH
jgi:hypothetical protein